jgi:hypothetical protein
VGLHRRRRGTSGDSSGAVKAAQQKRRLSAVGSDGGAAQAEIAAAHLRWRGRSGGAVWSAPTAAQYGRFRQWRGSGRNSGGAAEAAQRKRRCSTVSPDGGAVRSARQ